MLMPGSWTMALLIARCGTVGVVFHHVPCTSRVDVQNFSAFTIKKVKPTFHKKLSTFSSESRGFVHAKSRTRIGHWSVCSLGSLSDKGAQLHSVIDTMKNTVVLALSKSCWLGNGVPTIRGTTILYFSTPSSYLHGVAILLSPLAKAAWDDAENVSSQCQNESFVYSPQMPLVFHVCCLCVCSN